MTQHKVISDDSMTAMDEISRVLGQDAVILSTKKVGEKIEIIGSNDIKDILKSNKKNFNKPNFKELFSNVPLTSNSNDKQNKNVKQEEKEISNLSQKNLISKTEFEDFKTEIKSILNDSIMTDLNSLNNNIDNSYFIKLLKKGYSKKTINSVFNSLSEQEKPKSIMNFYSDLSKKLTFDLKEKLLSSKIIFVSGLTGVGKTSMCAKIASYLLDQTNTFKGNDKISLINLASTSPHKISNLVNYGRVLNLNVNSFSCREDLENYILHNKNKKIIIDISKEFLMDNKFYNYLKINLLQNKSILINIVQSGINFKSLEKQLSHLKDLNPINALTKLDEITINSFDFSIYHDLNCKFGLLSGTNNIIDSIAFANSEVLAQYMKDN